MSDTAYMIVIAFMSIYVGILIGLSMQDKPALQPVPAQPVPLATPPTVEQYQFQISMN